MPAINLFTESDAIVMLSERAAQCNAVGTDILRLKPPEFCRVVQLAEAHLGWSQNVYTGFYQPFTHIHGQRFRVFVGLSEAAQSRFHSLAACADLLGG